MQLIAPADPAGAFSYLVAPLAPLPAIQFLPKDFWCHAFPTVDYMSNNK